MASKNEEPAIIAIQCYERGDYSAALRQLTKLEAIVTGPAGRRLLHNRTVLELAIQNMHGRDKFTAILSELVGVTFPDIDDMDMSNPFYVYNYSVLLFHSRYYYQCTVLLEKLLASSKSIKDSKLIRHAVLLFMEAALCRRTPKKSLEIAKTHADTIGADKESCLLFDRIVSRANLMLGNKIKALKTDNLENLFIIAQEHYISHNAKEAVDTLAQYNNVQCSYDLKTESEDLWAALNNNLGVIYLSINKPFLATKYFQHAVKEHFRSIDIDGGDRLISCGDRPLYAHNLGLSLLSANKPEGAFECLVEAARHYPNNARIWLRLAECCVKKCCNDDTQKYNVKRLGSGPHGRILVVPDHSQRYSISEESLAIPTLSLEFAALCLRNAFMLLQNDELPADVNNLTIQMPPGAPINWRQRCYLLNSILVLQSYVLLKLQDPLSAYLATTHLLSQPEVAQSHKALAHIYASEALMNLDRVSEVSEHLNPQVIHELTTGLPTQMRDVIGVAVWAKAAVCHILKGDLTTARKIVLQINSPRILPLQMYLELCSGNLENCQTIIRKLRLTNLVQA